MSPVVIRAKDADGDPIMPKGVRNKNPGNLRQTHPRTPWVGQVVRDDLTDREFEQFREPEFGIRALVKVLTTYHTKRGLKTVEAIINRWAPAVENDTDSYVEHVAAVVGVEPNAPIDINDHGTMFRLVEAIILHENGVQPYSRTVIDRGLSLAGIHP